MSRIFRLLILPLLIVGCSAPPVYENYIAMDNQVWNRFDFLFFEVPVESDQLYDFFVETDLTKDYPWDYLELNITFYESNGGMRSADYVYEIDKSKTNKEGHIISTFTILKEMKFNSTGICKVRVESKMYKIHTPGVSGIGVMVLKSKPD